MTILSGDADHPAIRLAYPDDIAKRFFRLWKDRERFFQAMDRLPQTLLHGDANCANLFAVGAEEGDERTTAIDWACIGSRHPRASPAYYP